MKFDSEVRQLLHQLDSYFNTKGYPYVLIGANVPFILIDLKEADGKGFGIRPTMDLDFCIQVNDWQNYNELKRDLLKFGFAQKDNQPEHRFFKGNQSVDIMPYGVEIAKDGFIEWPGTGHRMNVVGFDKLFKYACQESISDGLSIPIIPLPLLVYTKINAYLDRRALRDLQDILYVLEHYEEVSISERRFDIIADTITYETSGAFLLGLDLKGILEGAEFDFVDEFLQLFSNEYTEVVQQLSREIRKKSQDILELIEAFRMGIQK